MVSNSFAIKRARALPTRSALTKRSREPESLPKTGLTAVLAVDTYDIAHFTFGPGCPGRLPGLSFPGTGVVLPRSARRGCGQVRFVSRGKSPLGSMHEL